MTFRTPELLWLAALVPFALAFLVVRERERRRVARRFVSERLRGVANPARPARPWLLALALLAALAALAGPRAGFTTVPVTERESNRVVAIDVSNSMGAEDIGTSRLAAAKALAKRLIDAHAGRVGLIEFESGADVISPLTTDSEAVLALLETILPGDVGRPGSDLGAAIDAAARVAESDPGQRADVVLISDGEDQGSLLREALTRAKAKGIAVHTILVGSPDGATIPTPGGNVLHDESGQVVTTYARGDLLQTIARTTGGTFLENPFAEHGLDPLLARRGTGKARERQVRVPIDRYQWPLALAFAFLFLGSLAHRGAE
jgi:Ca-activated chloride channel family protein